MISQRFELYVAGTSPRTRAAVRALTELCEAYLAGSYEVTVIDVLERPDRAEAARILATPTVVRIEPAPEVRLFGDLSLTDRVAAELGLTGDAP